MNSENINHLSSFTNQRLGHAPISHNSIELLASDISKNLSETTKLKNIELDSKDKDIIQKKNKEDDKKENIIPKFMYEPIIITILYVILSQNIVYQNISRYLTILKPNEMGEVSQFGILIYGIILGYLFFMIKNIIL